MVQNTEVVVGDIMFLDTGDKIIADGVLFKSQGLVVDEASLTGESDPIKKDPHHDPWCRSGTTVSAHRTAWGALGNRWLTCCKW